MKAPIGILALFALNASALPFPDADCIPHTVADSGYVVQLAITADGYEGHLAEQRIYGPLARFHGPVKLEAYKDGEFCKVLVTNPIVKCGHDRCVSPNSFELQIEERQVTKLLSVGGQRITDPGSTMDCEYSPRFVANLEALCSAL